MGAEVRLDLQRTLGAALALLAVAALAACGAGSGPQPAGDPGARDGTETRTASAASDIFFPQVREGLDGGPDALMSGKLVLDDEGCLRLGSSRQGGTWVPVWPANLRLETGGGKVRIVDGRGRTAAEVGKTVSMGGGEFGLPRNVVDPRTARELRSRCPGHYWIATEPSTSSPRVPGPPRPHPEATLEATR